MPIIVFQLPVFQVFFYSQETVGNCSSFSVFRNLITHLHQKGPFHVTDITSREQNFGNKTIFYKLSFYRFWLKFVHIILTWYLTSSRKETLISFTNATNMFVLNSVTDITKKSTYDFSCSLDTTIPVN